MIIDTSVLIAILQGETDAMVLVDAIASADTRVVAAPTLVEAAAVILARKGPQGEIALDALLQRLDITVVEMTPEAAAYARSAYARYGKGVGSPGVLNYGDCLAYGVAMATGEQLLFKGDDFSKTDVPHVALA
jgi:ribonuclease VapC